jgi:hypothetical protein
MIINFKCICSRGCLGCLDEFVVSKCGFRHDPVDTAGGMDAVYPPCNTTWTIQTIPAQRLWDLDVFVLATTRDEQLCGQGEVYCHCGCLAKTLERFQM